MSDYIKPGDRSERQILVGIEQATISIALTLNDVLMELKRANAVERSGSVSSASVKTAAAKREGAAGLALDIETKAYAGSPVPTQEALEAYGEMVRGAYERFVDNLQHTVSPAA